MKVELINAGEVFDDDNNGYIYGLQETNVFPSYIEWFKNTRSKKTNYYKK